MDITFQRDNVTEVVDAAAGTLAHGPMVPALEQAVARSVARGIDEGTRPLRVLGWVALIALAFSAAQRGKLPAL